MAAVQGRGGLGPEPEETGCAEPEGSLRVVTHGGGGAGMGAPGFLWAMLLLDLHSSGMGSNSAGDPPQQVKGILGGSILFPLKLPPTVPVIRIEWFFQRGSGPKILIAEFGDGKLKQPNASGRFRQQLEMAGNTTLRIRALEKGHSGMLKARVLFATHEVHEETFRLSVFEPIPDPQIHHQVTSKTAEGCNVTLQCLPSKKGPFNISWKRGDQSSVLQEVSGWKLLSAEGLDLHVSWRPNTSDSTVTCLLRNPIDQKNISFNLLSICQNEGASGCLSWVRGVMLVGLLVQIVTVASLNILERTGQKQN